MMQNFDYSKKVATMAISPNVIDNMTMFQVIVMDLPDRYPTKLQMLLQCLPIFNSPALIHSQLVSLLQDHL